MDHWTEKYCEEENNLIFEKASLFTFFEKDRAICEFRF